MVASCRLSWPMSIISNVSTTGTATASGINCSRKWAKTIAKQCRESDLPARYGGEEFAILVPNEAIFGAVRLAERCRLEIEKVCLPVKGEPVRPTASFGVADTVGVSSADFLVDRADQALYQAKSAGRNRVTVRPGPTQLCEGSNQLQGVV